MRKGLYVLVGAAAGSLLYAACRGWTNLRRFRGDTEATGASAERWQKAAEMKDQVDEASEESFPASDPPAGWQGRDR